MRKSTGKYLLSIFFAALMFAPALAQQDFTELEPNDSRDASQLFDGFLIEGEVGSDDPSDWYVLAGQQGEFPVFTLIYDHNVCDIDLEVYSDDELACAAEMVPAPETISCHVPGTCYLKVHAFMGYGKYSIAIEDPAINASLSINPGGGTDETEPNNDPDSATLSDLSEISEISGLLGEGDEDWYILDTQDLEILGISLETGTPDCFTRIEIFLDDESIGVVTANSDPVFIDIPPDSTLIIQVAADSCTVEYKIEFPIEIPLENI